MGTNKGEMAIKVIAALVLCLAVTALTHEVHELDDNQAARAPGEDGSWPNEMHNRIAPGSQGAREGATETWGTNTGNTKLNMPGAPYGKPGYKESHNWESDVDLTSPVVFNWRFYKASSANIGADQDEEAVKAYWVNTALAPTRKYPNCDQASEGFAPDMFYRAQKNTDQPLALDSSGEISCLSIVKDFLSAGIYTGKKLTDAKAEADFANSNPDQTNRLVFKSMPITGKQSTRVSGLAQVVKETGRMPYSNDFTFMFMFDSPGKSDSEQGVLEFAYPDGKSDDPMSQTPVEVPVVKITQSAQADYLTVELEGMDGPRTCTGSDLPDGAGYLVDGWNQIAIRVGDAPHKLQIWQGAGSSEARVVKECDAPNDVVAPPTQTSTARLGVPPGMPPSDGGIGGMTEATSALAPDVLKLKLEQLAAGVMSKK